MIRMPPSCCGCSSTAAARSSTPRPPTRTARQRPCWGQCWATSSPARKWSSPRKPACRRRTGGRSVDASRNAMLSALDASLVRLGTDYVDIWFAQAWDHNVPLDETLSALELAVRSGPRALRGSGELQQAGRPPRQPPSPDSRSWPASRSIRSCSASLRTELIPAVEDAGMGLMAWAPVGPGCADRQVPRACSRGFASGRKPAGQLRGALSGAVCARMVEAVAMAARGLGRSPLDVALSWLLAQHGVATAIVGPGRPCSSRRSCDSQLTPLPAEISRALEDVSSTSV